MIPFADEKLGVQRLCDLPKVPNFRSSVLNEMNENLHGRINQWGQKAGLGHIMVLCATCVVVRLGGISWGSFWEDTNCFDSCALTQVWWCSRENRNLIDVIKRNKMMKHSLGGEGKAWLAQAVLSAGDMSQGWLVFSLCLQSAIGILPHPALATQTSWPASPRELLPGIYIAHCPGHLSRPAGHLPLSFILRKDLDAHIFSITLEPGYYTWLNVS